MEKSAEKGKLSLIEKISDKDGSIGCAVFVDPVDVKGFAESGKDRLILLGVKSGEPVTYYVGAGWSKDTRFDPSQANGRDLSKGPRMINYRRYISLPAIISKRKSNGVIE